MKIQETPKPPKWATSFLTSFCSEYYRSEIIGDLEEVFHKRSRKIGRLRASILYVFDVLTFYFKPYVRTEGNSRSSRTLGSMISNYSKVGFRKIYRNKVYAVINVMGLAMGLCSSLLIALFIQDEMSYDTFFKDADHIYRLSVHIESANEKVEYAVAHPGLGTTLVSRFPEVEEATQIHKLYWHPKVTVVADGESFVETKLFLADSNFLKFFNIELIEGDMNNLLTSRKHAVLSESTARQYFGDQSPMGKVLRLDYGREMVVVGVMKDLPKNSHFDFELLGTLEFMNYLRDAVTKPSWSGMFLCNYIKVKAHTDPNDLLEKFPALVESDGRNQIDARYGEGTTYRLGLQPLKSIHLDSQLDGEMTTNGDRQHIYLLIILCILIVAVSCINFINLTSAQSSERAKEVAIRKVMGSGKISTMLQFLIEAIIISFIGMLLAVLMVALLLPAFNEFVGKELSMNLLYQPPIVGILFIVTIVIGLLSGWYPAMIISHLKTSNALKGSFKTSSSGLWFRNLLVGFQFFISIGLITGTLIIRRQLDYLSNKPLGYDKEQTLVIHHPLALGQDYSQHGNTQLTQAQIIERMRQKMEVFKHKLHAIEGIESAGSTFQMMGNRITFTQFVTDDPDLSINAHFQTVDNEFLATMGIEVIMGRSLSDDYNEERSILINEAAMRQLGWDEPLGRTLAINNGNPTHYKIIGVVKDYHFLSLHQPIGPLMIISGEHSATYAPTVITVRLKAANFSGIVDQLEQAWNDVSPDESLSFSFLNEDLDRLYQSERTSMSVIQLFAFLAIFIAVVGLFGLVTYDTHQRTKEIGIRKVLGGSIFAIAFMITNRFLKLIAIAFFIAVLPTYFMASNWLDDFAYKISIDLWPFVLGLMVTIILVVLTAGYKSIEAAMVNPVQSLRDE